ncbi:phenylacetate--CoA ligase family protein [Rubripirellula amarantea]|nr:AMP-binding protein [Rubripirellula amarantea]
MRLNEVLSKAIQRPFYKSRFAGLSLPLTSPDQLIDLPLLCKDDLVSSKPGLPARIFDLPKHHYSRLHQTSGTQGHPMVVLDTLEDWRWWLRCWDAVLDAANVNAEDVALMAFSFGPFIGFWTANDSLVQRGALVVPGGGVSSESRLKMIEHHKCTIVCCTPTYALHLGKVADEIGFDLVSSSVTRVIVAGEPGGSLPTVRARIKQTWGAKVIDHAGGSEVGAWGFGSDDGKGLHVNEAEFIAEVLQISDQHPSGHPCKDGEEGELVLTNLGRHGGPAIRYRTGDIVRPFRQHGHSIPYLWLDGGVLGRADDMVVIRGVNVFPSSVEAIVREIEPSAEFQITITRVDEMDQLSVGLEGNTQSATKLAQLLRERLAMRIDVRSLSVGELPRFEAKSKRVVDLR